MSINIIVTRARAHRGAVGKDGRVAGLHHIALVLKGRVLKTNQSHVTSDLRHLQTPLPNHVQKLRHAEKLSTHMACARYEGDVIGASIALVIH